MKKEIFVSFLFLFSLTLKADYIEINFNPNVNGNQEIKVVEEVKEKLENAGFPASAIKEIKPISVAEFKAKIENENNANDHLQFLQMGWRGSFVKLCKDNSFAVFCREGFLIYICFGAESEGSDYGLDFAMCSVVV